MTTERNYNDGEQDPVEQVDDDKWCYKTKPERPVDWATTAMGI